MPPFIRIDVWEMRCRFNKGRYWQRMLAGEFRAQCKRDRHPAPAAAGQPFCTRSQEVIYFDNKGVEIARVHQYLRPDQTLGGRGKPDPKMLYDDGVLYRLRTGVQQVAPTTAISAAWRIVTGLVMRVWGPIRCMILGR